MRLPGAFSTFLLTLSLTKALPVHSLLTLTTDDFEKTVAEGYWFIEHFSPWCHHCREFKPTWEKLVDKAATEEDLKHVKLAQVNCATHGDLCDAHGVTGYPQMNLYENGKFVKTFKGVRDMDRLTEFLKTSALKPSPAEPTVAPEPTPEAIPEPVRAPAPKLNLEGQVQALSKDNFQSVLDQGPTFVKFFAPWCGHCKKLAPAWAQLARHMQGKMNVAEVNCDDHGSLCSSQGVQGYPTLIYFQGGNIRTEYNGGRKIEQLREFAEMVTAPPMVTVQPSDIEKHLSDKDVAFVLVQTKYDDAVARTVETASTALFGSAPVFATVSSKLLSDNQITASHAILVYKGQLLAGYTTSTTNLDSWLLAHSLPASLELEQDSFQRVMNAPHKPHVVIASVTASTREQVSNKMREIGKKWLVRKKGSENSRDVVFTWMDGEKWNKWMKNMYGIDSLDGETHIVISNHANLVYYDKDAHGKPLELSATRLFDALEALEKGKLKAKNSENIVERFARYTSKQLVWGEEYVIAHPLHALAFVMSCGAVIFWLMKKWLSVDDLDAEHGHGHGYAHAKKGSRLD